MTAAWQLAALAAALLTALGSHLLGPRLRAALHARLGEARLERLRALAAHPAVDHGLALLTLALAGGLAWRTWDALSPQRAPTGPDYENFLGSALAFETGRWELYYDDRYPGFPWLVSVFADGPLDVLRAGTELSMALTALAALPLYWIGRLLAGRAAGLVGALLALRLAIPLDIGHSYTHYPLTATLDLGLLALGLAALATASLPRAALALGAQVALATLALASDPKQLPLALGLVGLSGLGVALLGPGRAWARAPLALAGLLPLPLAHALVGRYHLGLISLEGLTIRTPLRFVDRDALVAVKEQGWALGGEDAWARLPVSFLRVAQNVLPKAESGLDPAFLDALPRTFPDTSLAWLAALALLPVLLLWRGPGGLGRRAASLLLLLLFAASAASPLRIHYAHRYALPYAEAAPVGVTSALSLALGGPATLAAGLLSLSVGPYSEVSTAFLARSSNQGDIWIGYEKTQDLAALEWAVEHLPPEAQLFDYGERQAMPALAAGFGYSRCVLSASWCAEEMAAAPGPLIAVLRVNDRVSAELPGGDHERLKTDRHGRLPEQLGDCWSRVFMPGPGVGLYRWTCEAPPSGATHRGAPPPPRR